METMETMDGNGALVPQFAELVNSNVAKGFLKPFLFRLIIQDGAPQWCLLVYKPHENCAPQL